MGRVAGRNELQGKRLEHFAGTVDSKEKGHGLAGLRMLYQFQVLGLPSVLGVLEARKRVGVRE